MSRTPPEYVRVYQSIVDDEKFATIFDDDHHLAAWLRLLMAADATWPASAPIPIRTRKASLSALVAAGLIDLNGSRFRIHGLDDERERRANVGRAGGKASGIARTNVEQTLNDRSLDARTKSNVEEKSREEKSRAKDEPDPWDDPEAPLLTWLANAGCLITPGYHRHLVTAVEVHGVDAILATFDRLAKAGMKRGDVKGYIFGAIDALNAAGRPDPKSIAAAEAAERERLRTQRALAATRARIDGYNRTPEEAA